MYYEDALKFIIHCLRNPSPDDSTYGYDIYLPRIVDRYLSEEEGMPQVKFQHPRSRDFSPHFYAAFWELCRMGILRPGIKALHEQATDDGSGGNGYSIIPNGRTWVAEAGDEDFVPTEPERFGQMLRPYRDLLGPGFYQRAQEAVRCLRAHAYLACCAMCGAAAESILLAVAIQRENEEVVLGLYGTSQGRSRVESLVLGQAKEHIGRQVRGFAGLLTRKRHSVRQNL